MAHALPAAQPLNLRRRFALTSLAVILVIALGLGWLLSHMLTQRMLQREGEVTMDFVQNLLTTDRSGGFLSRPDDPELRARFLGSMEHVTSMREPVRANAYRPDGTVAWSTDKALVGRRYPVNDELDDALKGELVVHSGRLCADGPAKAEHEGLRLAAPFFVESYIPIRDTPTGQVLGVMEFYKVPVQLNEAIREGLIQLWLACAAVGRWACSCRCTGSWRAQTAPCASNRRNWPKPRRWPRPWNWLAPCSGSSMCHHS